MEEEAAEEAAEEEEAVEEEAAEEAEAEAAKEEAVGCVAMVECCVVKRARVVVTVLHGAKVPTAQCTLHCGYREQGQQAVANGLQPARHGSFLSPKGVLFSSFARGE